MSKEQSKPSSFKVIEGQEAKKALPLERVRALTRHLMEGVFDAPPITGYETRDQLRALLGDWLMPDDTLTLAGRLNERRLEQELHDRKNRIHESLHESATEFVQKGNCIAAVAGETTVGMACIANIGSPEHPVYEIKRLVVDPNERYKGIGSELLRVALAKAQRESPGSPVTIHTKDAKVKQWAVDNHFQPMAFKNFCELYGFQGEELDERVMWFEKYEAPKGWEVLCFDPKKRVD